MPDSCASSRRSWSLIVMLAALLNVAATATIAAQATTRSSIQSAFLDSVPRWMAESHVPGIAVAMIERRAAITVRTFGVAHDTTRLTAKALWNVASLTKPVVAITTLRLIDTKRLSLDASLDRYWIDPDVRDDPKHSDITVRRILSHQTGLPNWRWEMPDKRLGFLFAPGAGYHYSGEGFEYLRHTLESMSGRTLQSLTDSVLFKPLGLRETTFGWNVRERESRLVSGHDTAGGAMRTTKRTMAEPNAADWLVTTIGDYATFGSNVLRGARLSSTLYDEMLTPQAKIHGTDDDVMGLSWEILRGPATDPRILVHTGSDDGIKTLIVLLPATGRGIVIFTNGDRGMDVALHMLKGAFNLKELTP